MAAPKRTPKPKRAPARQSVGRERVVKPVREVIHHPSEHIPLRAAASASKLQGTIKGASAPKGKTKDTGTPLKPLPARFNIKPDGTVMTPKEMYDTYAASGQYDVSQAQIDSYANLYNQAVSAQAATQNPVNQLGNLASSVGAIISDVPGLVTGDSAAIADANAQATNAMNIVRNAIGAQDHISTQSRVGGTKGSKGIVDRSAANKKAWITRKQLYGSSGQKGK